MSSDRALEPAAAEVEVSARHADAPDAAPNLVLASGAGTGNKSAESIGAWPLDEPFPAVLTAEQLARVFGISNGTYFNLRKLGRFAKFELTPALTGRTGRVIVRYSGALVRQYISGQWTNARSFGKRRAV